MKSSPGFGMIRKIVKKQHPLTKRELELTLHKWVNKIFREFNHTIDTPVPSLQFSDGVLVKSQTSFALNPASVGI